MDFLRFGIGGDTRPKYYLEVDGYTEDQVRLNSPSILGDMKGKMEIRWTSDATVTFRGAGIIMPSQNDVLWRIGEAKISHFDYEIYSQSDAMEPYAQIIRSYNETTYFDVDSDQRTEINNFEVEVFANTEDPSTWSFRIVDVY
tara:strand:- start:116 stop:544 length:429 start_codon:yes stop_codon:yes gene_type:complete